MIGSSRFVFILSLKAPFLCLSTRDLLLHLQRQPQNSRAQGRRPFRFESLWIRKTECEDIVRHVWESPPSSGPIERMLYCGEVCTAKLVKWSRDASANPHIQISRLQKEIHEL